MRAFFVFIFFLGLFFTIDAFTADYSEPERYSSMSHLDDIIEFEHSLSISIPEYRAWTIDNFMPPGLNDFRYHQGYVFKNMKNEIIGYILAEDEPSSSGIFRMRLSHIAFYSEAQGDVEFHSFQKQVLYAVRHLLPTRRFQNLIVDVAIYAPDWQSFFFQFPTARNVTLTQESGTGTWKPVENSNPYPPLAQRVLGLLYSKSNKRWVRLLGDGRVQVLDKNKNLLREFPAISSEIYREFFFEEQSFIIYYPDAKKKMVYSASSLEFIFALDVVDSREIVDYFKQSKCYRYFN